MQQQFYANRIGDDVILNATYTDGVVDVSILRNGVVLYFHPDGLLFDMIFNWLWDMVYEYPLVQDFKG